MARDLGQRVDTEGKMGRRCRWHAPTQERRHEFGATGSICTVGKMCGEVPRLKARTTYDIQTRKSRVAPPEAMREVANLPTEPIQGAPPPTIRSARQLHSGMSRH